MKPSINYTQIIAICHGKSEHILCESLRSNFRIPMLVEARKKGKSSIQVDGIRHYLSTGKFFSHKKLYENHDNFFYTPQKGIQAILFPIMDLDDCSEDSACQYKNGLLFEKTPFYNQIRPIFNKPNLDEVLRNVGYKIDKENKRKSYEKIFPGQNGDQEAALELYSRLKQSSFTNLEIFIKHCCDCLKISIK